MIEQKLWKMAVLPLTHQNQRGRHERVTWNPLVINEGGGRKPSREISEVG